MSILTDYGVDKYDIGTGFGHFGIAVEDVRFCFLFISILVGFVFPLLFVFKMS